MLRRAPAALLALLAPLALLVPIGLALTPWTLTPGRLSEALVGQVKREYGLDLRVSGPIVVSLLPVPRIKLSSVSIDDPEGRFSVAAGQLKGSLKLSSLLAARPRLSDARIVGADIRLDAGGLLSGEPGSTLARLKQKLDASPGSSWINRIVVASSRVTVTTAGGETVGLLPRFDAVLRWPEKADLDVTASALWNGEPVTLSLAGLNPALFLAGQPEGVEIRVAGRSVQANFVGDVALRDGVPRFTGLGAVETSSIGALARWSGLGRDFVEVDRAAGVSGDCVIDLNGIEWPRVTMSVGTDRLEGSLAILGGETRPQVRATLAGSELDLSWVIPLADPDRALPPPTDYDVRLSANTVRFGALRLADVASGILIKGDRMEVSLGRASLADGTIRGRFSAILGGEARDFKGQVSLDGLRVEKLGFDVGLLRGLSGTAGGQATLEATGERQPDFWRSLKGRVSLLARDGEIAGVSLTGAAGGRTETAGGTRRSGRTRFGRASLLLEIREGVGVITEGRIEGPDGDTRLSGRVSLADGTVAVTATTLPPPDSAARATAQPPVVLDLRGPIGAPFISSVQSTGTIPTAANPIR